MSCWTRVLIMSSFHAQLGHSAGFGFHFSSDLHRSLRSTLWFVWFCVNSLLVCFCKLPITETSASLKWASNYSIRHKCREKIRSSIPQKVFFLVKFILTWHEGFLSGKINLKMPCSKHMNCYESAFFSFFHVFSSSSSTVCSLISSFAVQAHLPNPENWTAIFPGSLNEFELSYRSNSFLFFLSGTCNTRKQIKMLPNQEEHLLFEKEIFWN